MEKRKKLIIHETDCHGSGNVFFEGKTDYYAYDDEMGDVGAAVQFLIKIGFISPDDVWFIEGNDIYQTLADLKNR